MKPTDVLDDHRAILAGIRGNFAHRNFQRFTDNPDTRIFIFVFQPDFFQRFDGVDQGDTATRHDAFFLGGTGRAQRIFHPMFLLFEFGFGCGPNFDDGHTTGEFRHAFLQLLPIVIAGGVFDLPANLFDPAGDGGFIACTIDDGRIFFGADDARCPAQILQLHRFQFAADFLRDHRATGQDGDIRKHRFASVAEARRLDRQHIQHATQFVQDQRSQRFAIDILGDDHQVSLTDLDQFFQQRHDILRRADFLIVDEDVSIFNVRFHLFRIGDEIRADVPAVELHTLDVFRLKFEATSIFHRDDAVFPDLVHHIRKQLADLTILCGYAGHAGDLLLGFNRRGIFQDVRTDRFCAGQNATLEQHRVRASSDVLQALIHNGMGQNGGCRRAIPRDIIGLGRRLFQKLCAHILIRIFQLNLARHCHAIVSHGRCAKLFVQRNIAPLWPERGTDCIRHHLDSRLQLTTGVVLEDQLLCHFFSPIVLVSFCCVVSASLTKNPGFGSVFVCQNAQDVGFLHDQQFLVVQLDFCPGILGEKNPIAHFYIHRNAVTLIVFCASTHRQDGTMLWLLFCRFWQNQRATGNGLFLFYGFYHDSITQRTDVN